MKDVARTMNKIISLALMVVFSIFTLSGCAHRTPPRSTVLDSDPSHRTYSRSDLYGTGKRDTGAALESIDPSIQSSGGR